MISLAILPVLISLLCGCSSATRATVHPDDVVKVFPWPRDKQKVEIRVKPQTTAANTCVWLGSWEKVAVTPQTTFFITDQAGKKFAYTPARAAIRRLAPVDTMEIRWPVKVEEEKTAEAGPEAKQPAAQEKGEEKKTKQGGEKKGTASSD
ncbi:MAG: hypothetical protein D6806_04950 [Deltaproteobacteria bacterium]|nr:MAG: hypothetical protein D6806_04950 [Deltaproteobacteria bacterium]